MARLLRNIIDIQQTVGKARRIKSDPEMQPRSMQFGAVAILCSLFIPAFAALTKLFFVFRDSNPVVFILLGIIVGLVLGLAGTFIMFLQTLKNFCLQLYINRNPITWIALVFLIVTTLAAIIVLCIVFGLF